MDFLIGGVGLVRAEGRVAMANLGYDMRRLICLERRMVAERVCPEFGNGGPTGRNRASGARKMGRKTSNFKNRDSKPKLPNVRSIFEVDMTDRGFRSILCVTLESGSGGIFLG